MSSSGFSFLSVIMVVALAAGGFFAIKSLKSPESYLDETDVQTIGDLYPFSTEPTRDTVATEPAVTAAPVAETPAKPAVTPTTPAKPATNSLQAKLEALAAANGVLIKQGDKGPNVGTIQEFMNRYYKKTVRVDNDFGPTLLANVKSYQSANKISQTGQVGPATLKAMIEWVKKNPA